MATLDVCRHFWRCCLRHGCAFISLSRLASMFEPAQKQRWDPIEGFRPSLSSGVAQRELRNWSLIALGALAIAGVFALLLAISRIPGARCGEILVKMPHAQILIPMQCSDCPISLFHSMLIATVVCSIDWINPLGHWPFFPWIRGPLTWLGKTWLGICTPPEPGNMGTFFQARLIPSQVKV